MHEPNQTEQWINVFLKSRLTGNSHTREFISKPNTIGGNVNMKADQAAFAW
jgi:hypothetical protein